METANRKQPIDPAGLVVANLCLGKNERAMTLLEKATTLKVPLYDPLRSDRRFQALLQKVLLAN